MLGQQENAPATGMVRRYGYRNTDSARGRPQVYDFSPRDVDRVRVWVNGNGNPSYTFRFKDGSVLFTVDDYGAMNGLGHLSPQPVSRKRDLFDGWVPVVERTGGVIVIDDGGWY